MWLSQFVLGLISQHQFANEEYHELYRMNQAVDETLEEAFDYSGIWDTIGNTDSGFFGDWMAHPEELGGLGLTSMDFGMAYTHIVGANVYNPELVEMQVDGLSDGHPWCCDGRFGFLTVATTSDVPKDI